MSKDFESDCNSKQSKKEKSQSTSCPFIPVECHPADQHFSFPNTCSCPTSADILADLLASPEFIGLIGGAGTGRTRGLRGPRGATGAAGGVVNGIMDYFTGTLVPNPAILTAATVADGTIGLQTIDLIGKGSNQVEAGVTVGTGGISTLPILADYSFVSPLPITITGIAATLQGITVALDIGVTSATFSVAVFVETAQNSNLFVPSTASANFVFPPILTTATITDISTGDAVVVPAGQRVLLIAYWSSITSTLAALVTAATLTTTGGFSAGISYTQP